jgi:hypothetical protein
VPGTDPCIQTTVTIRSAMRGHLFALIAVVLLLAGTLCSCAT